MGKKISCPKSPSTVDILDLISVAAQAFFKPLFEVLRAIQTLNQG